jgi:hypothetical protein
MKTKKKLSAYIMTALFTVGFAGTQATAGILAEGNISVYKGGSLTNTITGQSPVDEEALLVCNEKCMLKSTGVSLIGATGSELSVKSGQGQFNLLLREGKVDFILSGAVEKMGFYTPDGQYSVADVVFNASTGSPVRGYMQVTEGGKTAVGVYEGRMIFSTVEGAKVVDSNNYILLAQAEMGAGAAATGAGGAGAGAIGSAAAALGVSTTTVVVGGVVVAAGAVAGGIAAANAINDDDDDPAPVVTTPPSRTAAGTAPNVNANSSPPAFPRNASSNI